MLMYFPGGFAQVVLTGRDRFLDWYAARLPEPETATETRGRQCGDPAAGTAPPPGRCCWPQEVTVVFGGLVAVNNASIEVGAGEVVGLIGTNGAGKSHPDERHRRIRSIHRPRPTSSSVPIERLAADRRAALGLGRAFQESRLFPDLTVLEDPGGGRRVAPSHLVHRRGRPPAQRVPPRPGPAGPRPRPSPTFSDSAPTPTASPLSCPPETRRIVELGCLLALESRVLCPRRADRGVAQREVEAFAPLLLAIRSSWAPQCW